jgi:hypothetical protein
MGAIMILSLEQIYFIGQTIAAVAVIGSLFYLNAQLREQNRESRHKAIQDMTANFANWQLATTIHNETAKLWLKGLSNFGDLENEERVTCATLFVSAFRIQESLYLRHLDGLIDERMLAAYEAPIMDLIPYPGLQSWWKDRKHWFQTAFREHIDDRIEVSKAMNARPSLYKESSP